MKRKRVLLVLGVWLGLWALVFLAAMATHQGRVAMKTALILPEVLPFVPIKPLSTFTPEPIVERVRYTSGGRELEADLYRPSGPDRHGAVIMFLGANPNLVHPVFLRLVQGLAREGVASLVPLQADLIEGKIGLADVDSLVSAFQYLEGREFVDKRRIGYLGFCVGAAFSILASADERIADRVAFVNAFGSYYDLFDFIYAYSSRRLVYEGVDQPWSPSELTQKLVGDHLIATLPSPLEQEVLRKSLAKDPQAMTELSSLSPEAQAVYGLLMGVDEARARELVGALPPEALEEFRLLSPSTHVAKIKARTFLMHDVADTFIPYVESRKLASRLPAANRYHTEFSLFEHVSPTESPDLLTVIPEALKLFRHLYLVMLEVG